MFGSGIDSSGLLTYLTNQVEPRHHKTNKVSVRPAKTQISLIWVFAGRTLILLVLSCGGSVLLVESLAPLVLWMRLKTGVPLHDPFVSGTLNPTSQSKLFVTGLAKMIVYYQSKFEHFLIDWWRFNISINTWGTGDVRGISFVGLLPNLWRSLHSGPALNFWHQALLSCCIGTGQPIYLFLQALWGSGSV